MDTDKALLRPQLANGELLFVASLRGAKLRLARLKEPQVVAKK